MLLLLLYCALVAMPQRKLNLFPLKRQGRPNCGYYSAVCVHVCVRVCVCLCVCVCVCLSLSSLIGWIITFDGTTMIYRSQIKLPSTKSCAAPPSGRHRLSPSRPPSLSRDTEATKSTRLRAHGRKEPLGLRPCGGQTLCDAATEEHNMGRVTDAVSHNPLGGQIQSLRPPTRSRVTIERTLEGMWSNT